MNGYVALTRPGNCAMISIAVVVTGYIALGPRILDMWSVVLLAATCAGLFAGAGNSLNDYFDAGSDAVNHPERPIPSGRVPRPRALHLAVLLFTLSVALAVYVSYLRGDPIPLLIVLCAIPVMVGYEVWSKARGFIGNLTISGLIALGFLFGGAVVGELRIVPLLALLAMLSNVGREIVKDIEDLPGDVDRQTLPRRVGTHTSGIIAAGFFGLAVALTPLPYLLSMMSLNYTLLVTVADIIFIYSMYLCFVDPSRSQRFAKAAMLVALAAFVAGRGTP